MHKNGVAFVDKKKTWIYTAIGAIALSAASLFLPIITYTSARTGITSSYNIFALFANDDFIWNFFGEYSGSFLRGMGKEEVSFFTIILCLIGLCAIVLAIVSIFSMSKQYESTKPFYLSIGGLIGTAIPSVVLLVLFLFSVNQFDGNMRVGAYMFITPIAMVIACLAVTSKHRLNREEARAMAEAQAYIRPAGDLPIITKQRGNQYHGQ